ncbi:MAG: right-handed parallel beta-helix repeat-containing protein [Candidatus Aenigmarchaeota archaeon]|nr:right-handed parallel beta-helix repeat-containing protein [Candidatus Aenigmarchaeota archaeon]
MKARFSHLVLLFTLIAFFGLANASPITSCGTISSSGSYDVSNDLSASQTCMQIFASNVLLDCHGRRITYSTSFFGDGIAIVSANNVTVKNCILRKTSTHGEGSAGVSVESSINITLKNLSISTTGDQYGMSCTGIYVARSSGVLINSTGISTSTAPSLGVYVYMSGNNTVSSLEINTTGNGAYGIELDRSKNNTIMQSRIKTTGVSSAGIYLLSASNGYMRYVNITTSGSTADGIVLSYSTNSTLDKANIKTTGLTARGIFMEYTNYSTFVGANISTSGQDSYGIYLLSSKYNIINSSIIRTMGTLSYGVLLWYSQSNKIDRINITTAKKQTPGVYFYLSAGNNLSSSQVNISSFNSTAIYLLLSSNNTIESVYVNISGIYINSRVYGIVLNQSSGNAIKKSTVSINGNHSLAYGIRLYNSTGNVISSSKINANTNSSYRIHGIYVDYSSGNKIDSTKIAVTAMYAVGIYLGSESNTTITATNISINETPSGSSGHIISNGIMLEFASGDRISSTKINITGETVDGILSIASSNISIVSTDIKINSTNQADGIYGGFIGSRFSDVKINVTGPAYMSGLLLWGNTHNIITASDIEINPTMNIKSYAINLYGTSLFLANTTMRSRNFPLAYHVSLDSSSEAVFLNATFEKSKISWGIGANNITIKWYARVHAESNGFPVASAHATVKDIYNNAVFSGDTNSGGLTTWFMSTSEILRSVGVNDSFNNHTIAVSKTGFTSAYLSKNISSSMEIIVDLSGSYSRLRLAGIVKTNSTSTPCKSCVVSITFNDKTEYGTTDSNGIFSINIMPLVNFTVGEYPIVINYTAGGKKFSQIRTITAS